MDPKRSRPQENIQEDRYPKTARKQRRPETTGEAEMPEPRPAKPADCCSLGLKLNTRLASPQMDQRERAGQATCLASYRRCHKSGARRRSVEMHKYGFQGISQREDRLSIRAKARTAKGPQRGKEASREEGLKADVRPEIGALDRRIY